eukprot:Partr_v1_DN26251_c1_g1_i1_m47988 putative Catalyzes the ferrous insertion into protoporphyrin IX (By similarity)
MLIGKSRVLSDQLVKSLTRSTTSAATATPLINGKAGIGNEQKPKTGILLMNLGGPATTDQVYPFLHRLFSDPDLIPIPFQKYLAPWIARRRTPSIQKQYDAIGGGSPITRWTRIQGEMMVDRLNRTSPETAPHKAYIGFRYAEPLAEQALREMMEDGVERAVAFTQYPQYSCSTTGSSLNELAQLIPRVDPERRMRWSLIDRWPTHSGLVKAFAKLIGDQLKKHAEGERDKCVLLFSAHSLPMSVVNRGDSYPHEVAATVHAVMTELKFSNPYRLVWQSQVGPAPWLGPRTDIALKGLGKAGYKKVIVVPIAFTSDHIETLFELDLEYGEVGKEHGISELSRSESLNDHPLFVDAMADLVGEHLKGSRDCSVQYPLRCPTCD